MLAPSMVAVHRQIGDQILQLRRQLLPGQVPFLGEHEGDWRDFFPFHPRFPDFVIRHPKNVPE
ncbi:hypothetical protein D3C81_1437400 [compost metagenome]